MFDNIGGKIKTLAVVICVIGMVASVISGISTMLVDERTILPGFVIILAGCLGSWVGSFFTYGFGQLIENTDSIASNTSRMASIQRGTSAPAPTPRTTPQPGVPAPVKTGDPWRCASCGTNNKSSDLFCRDCGSYR